MIDEEIYHSNEKIVNDIYLRTLAINDYSLTDQQVNDLEQIIYQCPSIGGEAVVKARILYELVNDHIFYDDDELCILQGVSSRMAKPNKIREFDLFPNPSNSLVTLNYKIDKGDKGLLKIIDQLGRPIFTGNLTDENNQLIFDCSNYNQGLYIYQIIINGELQSSKIFSIIK